MSERFDAHNLRLLMLLVAACVGTGVAAAIQPKYGVVCAVALALIAVVVWNVMVGLVLFTLMSFLENSGSSVSVMKVAGLVLVCGWLISTIRARRQGAESPLGSHRLMIGLGIAFVTWSAVSFAWATSSSTALVATTRYVSNFVLVLIVIGSVRRRQDVVWVMSAFVVGGLAAVGVGYATPQAATALDHGRLAASNLDSNQLALTLVVAVAFAVGLIGVAGRRRLVQWCLGGSIMLLVVGLFSTQSRSGLIALLATLIAGALIGGRWRRYAVILLVLGATATLGYVAVVAPANGNDHVTSTNSYGRSSLWTVGVRMFESHPVLGVGSGNFPTSSVQYINQPGTITYAQFIVDTPLDTHNIYLQLLDELGVLGLVALLGVVVVAAGSAFRAAARFRAAGEAGLELLARWYVCALVGAMTSSFFLPNQYLKQLWLVFALGPALLTVARGRRESASRNESWSRGRGRSTIRWTPGLSRPPVTT